MSLHSRSSSSRFRRNHLESTSTIGRRKKRRLGVETLEARRVLASYQVTSLSDVVDANDGVVSLREAVSLANSTANTPDTVTFAPSLFASEPGKIDFLLKEIAITDSLTITGPGAGQLSLQGGNFSRFFVVNDGDDASDITVSISGITFDNGNGDADENLERRFGGAILSREDLTITNSAFVSNQATFGGSIVSFGSLLVSNSVFEDNISSFGAAVLNYGTGTISNSTIAGNRVFVNGAGIRNEGTLTVLNSTVANNIAETNAGGISNTGSLTVLSSTIAGNSAVSEGGGGIFSESGSVTLHNTIVAGNLKGSAVASDVEGTGVVGSSSYNLIGNAATAGGLVNGTSNNRVGVDWKTVLENDGTVVTLKDNGGPTRTIALATDSPAIDKGNGALLPAGTTTDQRGITRTLDLTAVANAAGGDGTDIGSVEVVGSTAPVRVSLSRSSLEINEAGGVGTFTVSLSEPAGSPVTVSLKVFGSATNTVDYNRSATQVTIAPGATSGSITVSAIQDALDEFNESIYVDIVGVQGGVSDGFQRSVIFILDDDPAPLVTLASSSLRIGEANVATFTASLSAVSSVPVTVNLRYSGTATLGTDYTVSATSIVIAPGQLTGTATVTSLQDSLDEYDESVFVDIVSVASGRESGLQRTYTTIIDDDPAPLVTLSRGSASIAEAGGSTNITATLSTVSGAPVVVALGLRGSASLGTDYNASNRIIIPAGQLSASIPLTSLQDLVDEANETVQVDITALTGGRELGTQSVVVSILDDDQPSQVTLSSNRTSIAEAGGVATVTATLSQVSAYTIIVNLGFRGTANYLDVAWSNLRIVIAPGQLSGSITITAQQDTQIDPAESLIVDIIGVTNGTEVGNQSVTIGIDDDDLPTSTELTGSNESKVDAVMALF